MHLHSLGQVVSHLALTNALAGGETAMQLGLRTLGMILGLLGTVIAFVIDLLYGIFHVLGLVVNVTDDTYHFWWGMLIVLVSLVASLLGLINGVAAMVLLVACGVAFFFVVGWWALFASPFLFLAAIFMYAGRREPARRTAAAS
jgi:hypothetical protein